MNIIKKFSAIGLVSVLSISALAGCAVPTKDVKERESKQDQSAAASLELKNLEQKVALENNPETLRYVYVTGNTGAIVGYWTAKGKISSSSSQIAPEQDLIKVYENSTERIVVDSAKDDGSYGPGDPGIFFFTPDGNMIETSLDVIVSTQPIDLDVKRLG